MARRQLSEGEKAAAWLVLGKRLFPMSSGGRRFEVASGTARRAGQQAAGGGTSGWRSILHLVQRVTDMHRPGRKTDWQVEMFPGACYDDSICKVPDRI